MVSDEFVRYFDSPLKPLLAAPVPQNIRLIVDGIQWLRLSALLLQQPSLTQGYILCGSATATDH